MRFMSALPKELEFENKIYEAFRLLQKAPETNINAEIALHPPLGLRYLTQLYFDGSWLTSYARIAVTDSTAQLPQIPGFQDGIQYPLESDEIGVRDFIMDHNKPDDISKIYSGLHVRPQYMGQGIGSLLICSTNLIISDMITRFLKNRPQTRVYAFIVDGAHSNGTEHNRDGWTSFHAQKLGFNPTGNKKGFPTFMKRFPVKRILANSAKSLPALSTLHPHHLV